MSRFARSLRWILLAVAMIVQGSGAQANSRTPSLQERLGYPRNARLLIIHADDFGISHSENLAISHALDHGWAGYRWGPVAPADKVSSLLDSDDISSTTHLCSRA